METVDFATAAGAKVSPQSERVSLPIAPGPGDPPFSPGEQPKPSPDRFSTPGEDPKAGSVQVCDQTASGKRLEPSKAESEPSAAHSPARQPAETTEYSWTKDMVGHLEDAERLLGYLAEKGTEVDASIRTAVFNTRLAVNEWTEATSTSLLEALTKLAALANPVTTRSLKACADSTQARDTVKAYRKIAITLALLIVPCSIATFISSSLSDAIGRDLVTANALAVKLSDELGPPQQSPDPGGKPVRAETLPRGVTEKEVIEDLQQFAATIRAVDSRSRRLDLFAGYTVQDPFHDSRSDPIKMKAILELPPGLPNLNEAAVAKIGTYQDVRYFGQNVRDAVAMWFGAISTCVLPILYASLGSCAYLLRLFEDQIRTRTFTGPDKHIARFLMALIGGLIVGLFNKFNIADGASLSPLAVAFLVGYAVDVFFSFLEGLLRSFDGVRGAASPIGNTTPSKLG